jgi:hypothetical protein
MAAHDTAHLRQWPAGGNGSSGRRPVRTHWTARIKARRLLRAMRAS